MPGWLAKLLLLAAGSVCAFELVHLWPRDRKQSSLQRSRPFSRLSPSHSLSTDSSMGSQREVSVQSQENRFVAEEPAKFSQTSKEIDPAALGRVEGASPGQREGHESGLRAGQVSGEWRGRDQAEQDARRLGERRAYNKGYARGQVHGEQKAYADGRLEGEKAGQRAGYETGWKQGHERGRETGYVHGYEWGYEQGRSSLEKTGSYREGYRAGQASGLDKAEKDASATDFPKGWEAAREALLATTDLNSIVIDNASRWADEATESQPVGRFPETATRLLEGEQAEKHLYALGLASPSAINSAAVGRTLLPSASPSVVFVPETWPRQKGVPDFSADTVPEPKYSYLHPRRVFPPKKWKSSTAGLTGRVTESIFAGLLSVPIVELPKSSIEMLTRATMR